MPGQSIEHLSSIANNLSESFQSYMIICIIFVILATYIWYMIYLTRLKQSNCDYMSSLYPTNDTYIKPITASDPDCSGSVYDYYIKTAYNACSGGSYKNNFVDVCNLKAVINQGVRCLDFEIYSINNNPVVATSTSSDYYVKETFNSVNFASVMDTISNYAFSSGTCNNFTDPLLIHLRFKSNNQKMYSNLATIFASYDNIMLSPDFSFENYGYNIGSAPLLSFQNKIILIVDRTNNSFLQNEALLEYVNITSNSAFMREYDYYNVKNNPDVQELTDFNKRSLTIVLPDNGANPANSSGVLCRAYGCQMVAMRFQLVDNFLLDNTMFFDRAGYAFSLKPAALRYQPVTIPTPTPQNPAYSYATRNNATDYYNFNS